MFKYLGLKNNNHFASLEYEDINIEDEECNENSNNNEPKPPPTFVPLVKYVVNYILFVFSETFYLRLMFFIQSSVCYKIKKNL